MTHLFWEDTTDDFAFNTVWMIATTSIHDHGI